MFLVGETGDDWRAFAGQSFRGAERAFVASCLGGFVTRATRSLTVAARFDLSTREDTPRRRARVISETVQRAVLVTSASDPRNYERVFPRGILDPVGAFSGLGISYRRNTRDLYWNGRSSVVNFVLTF